MNGDVHTYKLAPMRWLEYKQLPDDLKKQFLQLCISKNARTQDIAEMFGVCKATVNTEYNRLNIMKKRFMPTASQDEWERFLNGAEEEQPETEIVPEQENTNPNSQFTSCELEFSDVTRDSLGDIVTFLQLLMDGVCTIKISVKRDME
ncbi:MAG: hypothetical protein MJY95_08210 [Bacteroidaceae bacterium]|nr:hypothetical protein [Bacteroidaceae bacterium]